MSTLEKDALRWNEILGRLRPSLAYGPERLEDIRRKHAADPEPEQEWQDIAADDAGVPRFGPF